MASRIVLSSRFLPPFVGGARHTYDQLKGLRPQERQPIALPIRFQAQPNPSMPSASRLTQVTRITLLRSDFTRVLPPTPRAQTKVPTHNPDPVNLQEEEELIEEAVPEEDPADLDGEDSAIGSLSDTEFSETASTGSSIDYADLEYLYFEAQDNLAVAKKTVFEFESALISLGADKGQLEKTLAILQNELEELKAYVMALEGIVKKQEASHQEMQTQLSSKRPIERQEIATQTDPDIVGLSKKEQKLSTAHTQLQAEVKELKQELSESAEREQKLMELLRAAQRENAKLKVELTELTDDLEHAATLLTGKDEQHHTKEQQLIKQIQALEQGLGI